MATPTIVQLVTRIPYDLRRRAKVHCVKHDTTLTRFVVEAIAERLHAAERTAPTRRTGTR